MVQNNGLPIVYDASFVVYERNAQGLLALRYVFNFQSNNPHLRLWHLWKSIEDVGMLCFWDTNEPLQLNMHVNELNHMELVLNPWTPQHEQLRAQLGALNLPVA